MIHIKVYSLVLVALLALFGATLLHNRISEPSPDELRPLENVSPLLPSADPGMDTSARYVRHLGLSTPGSAFPDFPAQPDYLPAGIMWPPPLRVGNSSDEAQILQDDGGQRRMP